jgi:hypothetical protein
MFKVSVGKVKYLDYEHEMFPDGNTLMPFLHKRLSFEHEHELRAVVQPITPGSGPLGNIKPIADGLLKHQPADARREHLCRTHVRALVC